MGADYRKFGPSAALQDYIESIWVQESGVMPDAMPTTILPTGRIELVLQFGDPYVQLVDGRQHQLSLAHVVGQQLAPFTVQATGTTGFVIVRFKPWGAASFFGAMLPEVGNRIVDLELIRPKCNIDALINKVYFSKSSTERALHVEKYVTSNMRQAFVDELAASAVMKMNENWGRGRITDLAGELGVSRRQLGRRFAVAVGASPKALLRVIRAQKAIACLRSGHNAQDIVDMCGFADQSHLIQEVITHSNKRPTELRHTRSSHLQTFFNTNATAEYCGSVYL